MNENVYSISHEQFAVIKDFIPPQREGRGRKRCDDFTVINTIIYVLKTGCQWKAIPKSFGIHYSTAWRRLNQWEEEGIWGEVHDFLFEKDRINKSRNPKPTGGCIDSESSPEKRGGEKIGFDGGKKSKRKKTPFTY